MTKKKKNVEIQGLVESKYFKCCIFFKSLSHVYKILLETKESLPYSTNTHKYIDAKELTKSFILCGFYIPGFTT